MVPRWNFFSQYAYKYATLRIAAIMEVHNLTTPWFVDKQGVQTNCRSNSKTCIRKNLNIVLINNSWAKFSIRQYKEQIIHGSPLFDMETSAMVKNKDTPKPHTNKLSVFESFWGFFEGEGLVGFEGFEGFEGIWGFSEMFEAI